jgi:hypothetical protein
LKLEGFDEGEDAILRVLFFVVLDGEDKMRQRPEEILIPTRRS